jgi:two-component system phosphate regulon sensor histidine kinase PhoR
LSHAESRARPIAWQVVQVDRVVDEAMAALAPQAAQKGLDLDIVSKTPTQVVTDPEYLRRIVENILDNAVKYTPSGGRVVVTLGRDDGGAASIEVRDTGPGIAAEHLPRIFERFYRVDQARSRELGGTGLGLAIVKHLAERLGAAVDLRSQIGAGSTFTIRIPATPTSPELSRPSAGTHR